MFAQIENHTNCDGVCETCSSCLYDCSLPIHSSNKECSFCPYTKKIISKSGKTAFICDKYKSHLLPNKKKVIAVNVETEKELITPYWCPLKDKSSLLTWQRAELWRDIKPICKFDDLKENTWYHIPPVNGNKRQDIFIVHKGAASIDYKKDKNSGTTYMMFKTELPISFLTEIKNRK